ncbi:MAG: hypothetical protein JW873_05755 [Candidatus Saganbacteria bacterium]|nr:hypothetical protein [Candidatus Saganbacteria bacterium]
MDDKEVLQNYVNNFRRNVSSHLKPNIGIQTNIYPCLKDGAIIEVKFIPSGTSCDNYEETSGALSNALNNINQNAFQGTLSSFHFSGTNFVMDPNRVILIKDDSPNQWNEQRVQEDVKTILFPGQVQRL